MAKGLKRKRQSPQIGPSKKRKLENSTSDVGKKLVVSRRLRNKKPKTIPSTLTKISDNKVQTRQSIKLLTPVKPDLATPAKANVVKHSKSQNKEVKNVKKSQRNIQKKVNKKVNLESLRKELMEAVESGNTLVVTRLLNDNQTAKFYTPNLLHEALVTASRLGHISLVFLLVEAGASVNKKHSTYGSPLLAAVEHGYIDVAKILLKNGAGVGMKSKNGDTALMLAVKKGYSTWIVKYLISYGAVVNEKNKQGKTPAMISIEKCDFNTLMILINSGADLEMKDNKGKSALMYASENKCLDFVKLLSESRFHPSSMLKKVIEKNSVPMLKHLLRCNFIHIDCMEIDGETVLIAALKKGRLNSWQPQYVASYEMIQLIVENVHEINTKGSNGIRPLALAAASGRCNIVQLLLDNGADVNGRDKYDKMTALMHAAKYGHKDVIKLLMKNKAAINLSGDYENSALTYALEGGHVPSAVLLLSLGATINARRDFSVAAGKDRFHSVKLLLQHIDISQVDVSVLSTAVQGSSYKTTELLIDSGMDVNALTFTGETLLMEASSKEMVELLLRKGALVSKKGLGDQTALIKFSDGLSYDANEEEQDKIIEILLKHNADPNEANSEGYTPLIKAALHDREGCAKLLLEAGADVNRATSRGHTAMMLAAQRGSTNILKLLLEKGACINVQAKDGQTALMFAAMNGYTDSAQLLLDAGADVNVEDNDGNTALLLSTEEEVVKQLLTAGADVNKQNKKGLSSLMYAARSRRLSLLWILVQAGADVCAFDSDKKESALSIVLQSSVLNEEEFSCIETLVTAGAAKVYSSHCDVTLARMIIHNKRKIVSLFLTNGGAPSSVCLDCLRDYHCFTKSFCDRLYSLLLSPLDIALICGNIDISNYLVNNWFLVESDLTQDAVFRDILVELNRDNSLLFLDSFLAQPFPLYKLAFVTVSDALKTGPDRENRIKGTKLPSLLQNKLSFKSETEKLEDCPADAFGQMLRVSNLIPYRDSYSLSPSNDIFSTSDSDDWF
ncbi:ankyrin repeat and KH domain-containing protein mask-like [Physella acuta]|uniref:ankyrin repeat and KH domain-containing protein mask-like n=1 Tax=Physella acuta TaxID=109671 RepID=UPI0027DB3139|nr:ankyrin repeat and KH domain-containing protein mask-like [Physella acuta]